MTEPVSPLPIPLKRPVASQRTFRALIKRIEEEVFTPPWRIVLRFYYLKRGELPDETDPGCYACATTNAQYHTVEIDVCPDHPKMREKDPDPYVLLLHETFHSFFGEINDALTDLAPTVLADKAIANILDRAEESTVNRLAAMPIFYRRNDAPRVD